MSFNSHFNTLKEIMAYFRKAYWGLEYFSGIIVQDVWACNNWKTRFYICNQSKAIIYFNYIKGTNLNISSHTIFKWTSQYFKKVYEEYISL